MDEAPLTKGQTLGIAIFVCMLLYIPVISSCLVVTDHSGKIKELNDMVIKLSGEIYQAELKTKYQAGWEETFSGEIINLKKDIQYADFWNDVCLSGIARLTGRVEELEGNRWYGK